MDDFFGFLASIFLLGLVIMLVIFVGMAAMPVGIAVGIGILIYKSQYAKRRRSTT